MKHILTIVLIGVFATTPLGAAEPITAAELASHLGAAEPLAASELAAHLGISHWESAVNLPLGTFSISFAEIHNGHISKTLFSWDVPGNDSRAQRVVIMASQEVSGMRVNVVLGSTSSAVTSKGVEIPLKAVMPLPASIGAGSYVRGGESVMKGKPLNCTAKIEDLKSGLLLQISGK